MFTVEVTANLGLDGDTGGSEVGGDDILDAFEGLVAHAVLPTLAPPGALLFTTTTRWPAASGYEPWPRALRCSVATSEGLNSWRGAELISIL